MNFIFIVFALLIDSAQPAQVSVSLFSIFKPKAIDLSGIDKALLKVTTLAEDGRRSSFKAASIKVNCGGRAPVCLTVAGKKICAASIQVSPTGKPARLIATVSGAVTREYAGQIEISEHNDKCLTINHVALEEYARSVACHEIRGAGPQALKAQLIASRTYALSGLRKHKGQGFDFCDLTHCQVYKGHEACSEKQHAQLSEVSGLALTYDGHPIEAYYFSTCGGHTAAAQDAWGISAARAYLTGVKDGQGPYCGNSEHMRWRFEVDRTKLCARLRKALPKLGRRKGAQPCSIEISKTGRGGWVSQVRISGKKSIVVVGDKFHMLLGKMYGWGKFKSARFTLDVRGKKYVFHGRGLGHGVGMCQYGAMGMEKAGADYKAILKHYYPGTRIEKWP
ncbi:MAG: SpoIID/LytB domain-containing protein [Deltaproteobacteria bacterium]|nr:SpoIID/LytB domain-containing protein [Deltaproteobacteria bacterium]